jgi:hypothetical protein
MLSFQLWGAHASHVLRWASRPALERTELSHPHPGFMRAGITRENPPQKTNRIDVYSTSKNSTRIRNIHHNL